MAAETLARIVDMVRYEAGHATSVAQGLNALETLKYIINRTEEELWTAFEWPQLIQRVEVPAVVGQYKYAYPAGMDFDQTREVFWAQAGSVHFTPLEYGIPESCMKASGENTIVGNTIRLWEDGNPDTLFRVWPTPGVDGTLRLRGMRRRVPMVDDADRSTLDGYLIALMVSSELLSRAKAEDAPGKQQKAQRHLQKLLAIKVSAKTKVSTFGAVRGYKATRRLTPWLDYIP